MSGGISGPRSACPGGHLVLGGDVDSLTLSVVTSGQFFSGLLELAGLVAGHFGDQLKSAITYL